MAANTGPDSSLTPPATVELTWCPKCGRDDRFTFLRLELPHNTPRGARCAGKPLRLVYELKGERDA